MSLQWAHSGVEVIARDRSTEYARGAREAAPEAAPVADRWHLLHNLREMLERFFRRIHGRLATLPALLAAAGSSVRHTAFPRTSAETAASQASRAQRLARYEPVEQLRQAGYSIWGLARALGMSRGGVRTFYYAASFPKRARQAVPPSILDPYLPYLEARLAKGCENASHLWRQIQQRLKLSGQRWTRGKLHLSSGSQLPRSRQGKYLLPALALAQDPELGCAPSGVQRSWLQAAVKTKLSICDHPSSNYVKS